MGSVIYLVEGEENGFTSIPSSVYWAIVTVTTVGYGDMVPKTVAGQVIASFAMILGYAIIAVPTGHRHRRSGPGLPAATRPARPARPAASRATTWTPSTASGAAPSCEPGRIFGADSSVSRS